MIFRNNPYLSSKCSKVIQILNVYKISLQSIWGQAIWFRPNEVITFCSRQQISDVPRPVKAHSHKLRSGGQADDTWIFTLEKKRFSTFRQWSKCKKYYIGKDAAQLCFQTSVTAKGDNTPWFLKEEALKVLTLGLDNKKRGNGVRNKFVKDKLWWLPSYYARNRRGCIKIQTVFQIIFRIVGDNVTVCDSPGMAALGIPRIPKFACV